jgi:hypothetical protein
MMGFKLHCNCGEREAEAVVLDESPHSNLILSFMILGY